MTLESERHSLERLEALAESADQSRTWPSESWACVRSLGALRWSLPAGFGGREIAGSDLLIQYEKLARACLTSAFILSQRESACRHLVEHGSQRLQAGLLPQLAEGSIFATVGLSHLTTSRQHTRPSLVAHSVREGFEINGSMPWVTGAAQADYFVTGAVLETSGQQILFVVPRDANGVVIGEAMDLMAVSGSMTTEVHCREVYIHRSWLLAGPAGQVLAIGRGGAGGLETTCLALGLATAAIELIQADAMQRQALALIADRLARQRDLLRGQLHALVGSQAGPDHVALLRAKANTLVLHATQAALTVSKGTGFRHPHPAQRWARQALFFLIWSCPWPAAEATLDRMVSEQPECLPTV